MRSRGFFHGIRGTPSVPSRFGSKLPYLLSMLTCPNFDDSSYRCRPVGGEEQIPGIDIVVSGGDTMQINGLFTEVIDSPGE